MATAILLAARPRTLRIDIATGTARLEGIRWPAAGEQAHSLHLRLYEPGDAGFPFINGSWHLTA